MNKPNIPQSTMKRLPKRKLPSLSRTSKWRRKKIFLNSKRSSDEYGEPSSEEETDLTLPSSSRDVLEPEASSSTNNTIMNDADQPIQDINEDENESVSKQTDLSAAVEENENTTATVKISITLNLRDRLASWAVSFRIAVRALSALLILLKDYVSEALPICGKTILKVVKKKKNGYMKMEPGYYYHFGLLDGIRKNVSVSDIKNGTIELVANVDGLPLAKSSSSQLWPILCYVRPHPEKVFMVGLYWGMEKPHCSNAYMETFINEVQDLQENGVEIHNVKYNFLMDCYALDAPAKAYVLKIKGHSGFSSCTKCKIEGEYLRHRVAFPDIDCKARTHQGFLEREDEEHHVGDESVITVLNPFNIVIRFVLDYMHLVLLGVVKKMIRLWLKGPLRVRMDKKKVDRLTLGILKAKDFIPYEFCRKGRTLVELLRFKATEFRLFLLYTSIPVFFFDRKLLPEKIRIHFLYLTIAFRILLSREFEKDKKIIRFVRRVLRQFVLNFGKYYGTHLISHNVHGLLHITDDFKQFGALDKCSAFPFENFMTILKGMVKKGDKHLQQVVNRYLEREKFLSAEQTVQTGCSVNHSKGPLIEQCRDPQFKVYERSHLFKINVDRQADCFASMKNQDIVKIDNFATVNGQLVAIGKKFLRKNEMFVHPLKSSKLGIYEVSLLSAQSSWYDINEIDKKYLVFTFFKDKPSIAMPLLHH